MSQDFSFAKMIFVFTLFSMLFNTKCSLDTLETSLSSYGISESVTYTFKLTYSNSAARSKFKIIFPDCVKTQSASVSESSGLVISNPNYGTDSSISFNLSGGSLNKYTFLVANVTNCYYASSFNNFKVSANDRIEESPSSQSVIAYVGGSISGCNLNFIGTTGNTNSKLNIPFKPSHQIENGFFGVQLIYSLYFSSGFDIAGGNTPRCGLTVNGSFVANSEGPSTVNIVGDRYLICTFSNYQHSLADNLELNLMNVANPVTETNYLQTFTFKTLHGLNTVDETNSCTRNSVEISIFEATLPSNSMVNTNFNLIFTSKTSIGIRVSTYDQIKIKYSLGTFQTNTNQIALYRAPIALGTASNFNYVSSSTNERTYSALTNNNAISTLFLYMTASPFIVPTSSIKIDFNLTFFATDSLGSSGLFYPYMKINAQLSPNPSTIDGSQASMSVSDLSIGSTSTYTLTFINKQPLSNNPSLILTFPSEIDLSLSSATINSCEIRINNEGVGSKSCSINSNTINIMMNLSQQLPINTTFLISLPNIHNPVTPIKLSSITLTTVYTSTQPLGLVETSSSLDMNITYGPRIITPYINDKGFQSLTSNTEIEIVYIVGIDLPNGSIVSLDFTGNLTDINYSGDILISNNSGGNVRLNNSNTKVFNFELNGITLGRNITFIFTCTTPSVMGVFPALSITTMYNSAVYEKTSTPIIISISQPKLEPFSINPYPLVAGETSEYSFSFKTAIANITPFNMVIIFPQEIDLLNGQAKCVDDICDQFTDTSSGSLDRVSVRVKSNPITIDGKYEYTIKINKIRNQRYVGSSSNFQFSITKENSSTAIINGSGVATTINPNRIESVLSSSDNYYLSNSNPVYINVNVTNKLADGDYFKLEFRPNTYIRNGGTISCSVGNCTFQEPDNLPLIVLITPEPSQIIYTTITLQIEGLISSSSTNYGQVFEIQIGTFTNSNLPIDKGILYYSISCGSPKALLDFNCKTCTSLVCTSCYPTFNLYNYTRCTNACGNLSQYETYPNSGVCRPCQTPCATCESETLCSKCIFGFYFHTSSLKCLPSCGIQSGSYIYNESGYLFCKPCTEHNCKICSGDDNCELCDTPYFLKDKKCLSECGDGKWSNSGICTDCNRSCFNCTGPTSRNCDICYQGYYKVNGECMSSCPYGSVPLMAGGCGCEGDCQNCIESTTKCLSCRQSPPKYYYKNNCHDKCPESTYSVGRECLDCSQGCVNCTSTTCMQCFDNFSIFESKCYSDCKEVGERFVGVIVDGVSLCMECSSGCVNCTEDYFCIECDSLYTLIDGACTLTCSLDGTCDLTEVLSVIPLPGLIGFGCWSLITSGLKLTFVKGLYVPYVLIVGGSMLGFVEIWVILGMLVENINSAVERLLFEVENSSVLGMVIGVLVLNYFSNFIFLYLFCKFLKPLLLHRQIDLITNYTTIFFGMLSTYRFAILPLTNLIKQPRIKIQSAEKLTPIHILLYCSCFVDILTFVVGIILVMKNKSGGNFGLMMLGIDLIILTLCLWMSTGAILFVSKPEEYYGEVKKYQFQENYITEEGTLHNNDKDMSKVKLSTNEKLQIEDYASEDIDDLPTLPPNVIKIAPKGTEKINERELKHDNHDENARTKRKEKNSGNLDKYMKDDNVEEIAEYKEVKSVAQRSENQLKSDSGKKTLQSKKDRNQSEKIFQKESKLNDNTSNNKNHPIYNFNDDDYNFEIESVVQETTGNKESKVESTIYRKSANKPINRSSTIQVGTMIGSMKKNDKKFETFESEPAESFIDELDLDSIVQTKMIDRSKKKQKGEKAQTEIDANEQIEEISPSWFNIPNQRYDIEDSSIE